MYIVYDSYEKYHGAQKYASSEQITRISYPILCKKLIQKILQLVYNCYCRYSFPQTLS